MYGALTLALAALGAAAPASLALEARQAGTSEPLRFQGLALAQGTPIDSQTLNANDGRFSIGRATTTSGPEAGSGVDPSKFNTDQTIFAYLNGLSKLSLSSTAFPGGQQVYVTAGDESIGQLAGQLKFVQTKDGATSGPPLFDGFAIVYDGKLQFEGKDWFACETDKFNSGYGIWAQSRVEGSNAGAGCVSFTWKVQQVGDETPDAYLYVK